MTKFILSVSIALSLTAIIHGGPVPDEYKDVAPIVRKTCLEESGASRELVENASVGKFNDDDPNLKCYMKCVFHYFELLNDKGFDFDHMMELTPPRLENMSTTAIKNCRETTGKEGDVCDFSYNIMKCFYETVPEEFPIL